MSNAKRILEENRNRTIPMAAFAATMEVIATDFSPESIKDLESVLSALGQMDLRIVGPVVHQKILAAKKAARIQELELELEQLRRNEI